MEDYYFLEDSKYYGILKETNIESDNFLVKKLFSLGLYEEVLVETDEEDSIEPGEPNQIKSNDIDLQGSNKVELVKLVENNSVMKDDADPIKPNDVSSLELDEQNYSFTYGTTNINEFDAYITLEDGKVYKLRNEMFEDIYKAFEYFIENMEDDVSFKKFDINIELEALIDRNEKISFLKNYYYNLFQKYKGDTSFMTYMGIDHKTINDFGNWKNEALYILSFDSKFLLDFLKGEKIILTDVNLYAGWKEYHTVKELAIHCKSELNKIDLSSEKNSPNLNKDKDIDISKKVLLFEKLMKIENWEGISATKKGIVLTHLFSKNHDNIRNMYLKLEKKVQDDSKIRKDLDWANKIIKVLG